MSEQAELFDRAYATIDRAIAARGSERQTLIEEAVRLYHAARALEGGEPKATRRRRSFGAKPSAH